MRYSSLPIVLAALVAASASAHPMDPTKLTDQLTGNAKGQPEINPQCKLFTQAEIAAYAGAEVGLSENSAGGAGCDWHDKS